MRAEPTGVIVNSGLDENQELTSKGFKCSLLVIINLNYEGGEAEFCELTECKKITNGKKISKSTVFFGVSCR